WSQTAWCDHYQAMTAFPWPEIPTASGRVCVKDDDAIVGSRVTFADATRCTCVSRGIEFLLFCSSSQQLLALPAQPGLWRAFAKNRSNSGAILPRDPFVRSVNLAWLSEREFSARSPDASTAPVP
ncbi:hypothetical protein T310_8792, partial [Rasamsonia emersonii CBS 393.64]